MSAEIAADNVFPVIRNGRWILVCKNGLKNLYPGSRIQHKQLIISAAILSKQKAVPAFTQHQGSIVAGEGLNPNRGVLTYNETINER